MDWQAVIGFGACGGALVSVVTFFADVNSWQRARHAARTRKQRKLPALDTFVDPLADSLALVTRMVLGCMAVLLFHNEVGGYQAAIAVGASAPALLTQFVTDRSAKALEDLEGTGPEHAASKATAEMNALREEG